MLGQTYTRLLLEMNPVHSCLDFGKEFHSIAICFKDKEAVGMYASFE